ncbi:MAG: glycosyltransferase family 4 protein [Gemmatimonadales bacterium]
MRVLLIHQAAALRGEPGGTRHIELAMELGKSGDQVVIVTASRNYLTATARAGNAPLPPGVALVSAYATPGLHRSFLTRAIGFAAFACTSFIAGLRVKDVDVVWGTSPPITQAATALMIARLRRRPFVFEVRDLWPDFAVDLGVLRSGVIVALARWLERLLYRRADALIINSPGFRDHLVARGADPARVHLVPNGTDVAMFQPSSRGAALRATWGARPDDFVVVYAGAHGTANDLGTVLEAAARLSDRPQVRLVLIGDGKEKPTLIAAARARGLDNVQFQPAVAKEAMPDVLAASDACIAILRAIPRLATTYPNKVFDYMAAGRPTVLAIDGPIRDVIEACQGGLWVPSGNAEALAEAVRRLDGGRDEARHMGERARAHVERQFDRGPITGKLREVLASTLRTPGR